jgi:hypothetical protein
MKNRIDSRYWLAATTLFLWGCPIDDARIAPTGSSGSTSSGEGSSSSSNASSSSASGAGGNAGGGGMGGVGGMAGAAGTGGGPVCPPAGTLNSCGKPGCPDCPTLAMIATGASNGKTSRFDSITGWTMSTTQSAVTSADPPAFAIRTGKDDGVAVWRSNVMAELNRVKYAAWKVANGFATFGDVDTTALTQATPAITASSSSVHVAYLEPMGNDEYFHAQYDGSTFTLKKETVAGSIGKCSPALATTNATDIVMVNPGWNNDFLYEIPRTTSGWGAAMPHTFAVDKVTPAIVTLNSAPTLLVVMTKASGKILHSATYAGGMWDTQTLPITGALSTEPVLLALPGAKAILVYRAMSTNALYWSRFNGASWDGILPVGTNVTAQSRPALALGAGDAEAELLFVDFNGEAYHSRFQGGAFSAPIMIPNATGLVGIAAATNL